MPFVTLARPSAFALLIAATFSSLDARLGSQSVTVTTTGGEVRVQAPGFRFIKGEPLARLKDGRSVRVDLELRVLAGPGATAAAAQSRQTFVLSYDLWEERFAVTLAGTGSRSVSHLTAAAAEAWCLEQLTVPVSALGSLRSQPFWIRLESRVLDGESAGREDEGLTLRGLIDALSRRQASEKRRTRSRPGRSGSGRDAKLRVNRLRNRLIVAFLAATILPLAATIWITTSLLDRSLGYATTGELDRLSRTLEATVRQFYQREREALKQDALAGRDRADDVRRGRRRRLARGGARVLGERRGRAVRPVGPGGDHVDYLRRASGDGPVTRRRGLQPRSPRHPHGAAVGRAAADARARGIDRGPRPPARVHAHAAPAARRGVARVAGAARLHRASDQPADPAAHRRRSPTSPPATGRGACRSIARHRRARDEVGRAVDAFNRHGRSAAAEPRAARAPDADGELAVARAQDRARGEELADADSPDGRRNAGAAAAGRSRLHGSGRPDRRQRDRLARAARARVLGVRQRAAGARPKSLDVNALVTERVALLRPGASRHDVPISGSTPRGRACTRARIW